MIYLVYSSVAAYPLTEQELEGILLQSRCNNQKNGITQTIRLNGVQRGQGSNVKMRWKAAYSFGGVRKDEMGEIPTLGVP